MRGAGRAVIVTALAAAGLLAARSVGTEPSTAHAQQAAIPHDSTTHSCRLVMIPMRDAVKLNTRICEARAAAGPLPIIITRTPYGISGTQSINGSYRFLAADGYHFVFQDSRGRYGSEGTFLMVAPLRTANDARKWD